MATIFPIEIIQQTTQNWLPRIKVKSQLIYSLTLLFILMALVSLPFIKVDISIKGLGQIRPLTEKNELKSLVNGIIKDIKVKEGDKVKKGESLITLRQDIQTSKLAENEFEQKQNLVFLSDLKVLTALKFKNYPPPLTYNIQLNSTLYKAQYSHFIFALAEANAVLEKIKSNYTINKKLLDEKVIAQKDFSDIQYEYTKTLAETQALSEQQLTDWQKALSDIKANLNRLQEENKQVKEEMASSEITAPVSGTLQQFSGKYIGGHIQAGDVMGIISPDSSMIAECYLSPKDIGLVKLGMPVRFQVDAFNYNDWGNLLGKVIGIDNDFILVNDKPIFRIRCSLNKSELKLKNGFKGHIKKGMSVVARFILTKRSLFQLLYDRADNWLNPNQPGV